MGVSLATDAMYDGKFHRFSTVTFTNTSDMLRTKHSILSALLQNGVVSKSPKRRDYVY